MLLWALAFVLWLPWTARADVGQADSADFTLDTTGLSLGTGGTAYADSADFILDTTGIVLGTGGTAFADSTDFTLDTTGITLGTGGVAYADSGDFTLDTTGITSGTGGTAYADSTDFTLNTTGITSGTGGVAWADSADFTLDTTGPVGAAPDITLEQPAGTFLASGGTRNMITPSGSSVSLTFTIRNGGNAYLTGLAITKDGAGASDFHVTASTISPVAAAGTATFIVQFSPPAGGKATFAETAAIHIASNVAGKNPYNINFNGTALSYNSSTAGDGMSDGAKFMLTPLGFNWQVSQPTLVNAYYAAANAAGLYTQAQYASTRTAGQNQVLNSPNTYGLYTRAQVQAQNPGVPLLAKDAASGSFKLTLTLQKTTNLNQPFTAVPLTGTATTVNAQGQVEFTLTAPESAAFFRVQAQ